AGLARRAPRRAEIHERLIEIVASAARHQRGGEVPEDPLPANSREPAWAQEHPTQDAPHVGVEHGGVLSIGERQDRAGRVAPDARAGHGRARHTTRAGVAGSGESWTVAAVAPRAV